MTMIYGEITDEGTFRFISAAHPNPVIFSSEFDRIGELDEDNLNGSYPLGVFPSGESTGETQRGNPVKVKGNYFVNQIKLESPGDIILLHSDGLSDHNKKGDLYFPNGLEDTLRETKHLPAEEIVDAIGRRVIEFADPADDISYIVIKKV